MSAIKTLIEYLQRGAPLPQVGDLARLCIEIHARMVDDPLMLWLDVSFEDMADAIYKAEKNLQEDDDANT